MTWALDHYPIPVRAFFFGLIFASVFFVGKNVKRNRKTALLFVIGAIVAFFLTSP
jgi:putative membrane protein